MKNLKKLSREELKSVAGGKKIDPIGTGFCDTCTDTQQCCLDGTVYFCGRADSNCARQ